VVERVGDCFDLAPDGLVIEEAQQQQYAWQTFLPRQTRDVSPENDDSPKLE